MPAVGADAAASDAATPKGRRTRARLLAAGREVLEEHGYFGATVGEIAARGGVALGGFYHYFPNKERLFLVLLEELVDTLYSASAGGWRADADVRDNLRESTRRYLVAYSAHRRLISGLLEMAGAVPECREHWWDLRTRTFERMESHLRGRPGLAEGEARLYASALGSMVEGFAHHWYVQAPRGGEPSIDEGTELLSTIWFRAAYDDGDGG